MLKTMCRTGLCFTLFSVLLLSSILGLSGCAQVGKMGQKIQDMTIKNTQGNFKKIQLAACQMCMSWYDDRVACTSYCDVPDPNKNTAAPVTTNNKQAVISNKLPVVSPQDGR